jgi:drug/metabolite transporter (DMT)-like permease
MTMAIAETPISSTTAIVADDRSYVDWPAILAGTLLATAVSFVLLTWCIEKRGPVFVSAFIPVVQIIVAIIDFSILHESLYLGR